MSGCSRSAPAHTRDFDHDEDPSVAYVEGPGAARYFDRPAERAEYEHVFDLKNKRSIPIGEWRP